MASDLRNRAKAASNGEVAPRGDTPTLAQMINTMRPEIQRALPKHLDADRIARIATTVLRQTPALGQCTPESFLGALMTAAQLGLEPGPLGEAYLVPYGRNVTFIPGYRGLVKLAWQSGQIASLAAHVVYEGDDFDFTFGLEPTLVHRPSMRGKRGEPIAVYAVAVFKSGGNAFEVLSVADVERIRQSSRAGQSGPWVDHWGEMAKKTVIRRLAKMLPLSPELSTALAQDGQVRVDASPEAIDTTTDDFIEGEVVDDDQAPTDTIDAPAEDVADAMKARTVGHAFLWGPDSDPTRCEQCGDPEDAEVHGGRDA